MFSQNGKISERQLFRMIVVSLLGASLLICPRFIGAFGSVGFGVYIVAATLGGIYIYIVFRLKKINSDGVLYNMLEGFMKTIAVARLFLMAAGGLYVITDVVERILLPKTNGIMVIILLGILLVYWTESGLECGARAMELLFYWVIVPIVISLVVAVPNVEVNNLVPSGSKNVLDFIKITLFIWFIFTPAELVWLNKGKSIDNKMNTAIWKGFGLFWIVNVINYGIILGIYGVKGLEGSDTYPLIKVMQIGGVPGDFLRRVDGFLGAFLVVSIFCAISLAIVILKTGISGNGNSKMGKLFSYGIVAVIIFGVILIKGDDAYKGKKVYAGVELERRGLVMSVIMGSDNVIFEIATDEENSWQESSEYVKLDTNSLETAEKMYKENGDKVLDFSHMKILFVEDSRKYVGEHESENDKKIRDENIVNLEKNIDYMYKDERFGENILICPLAGDLSKMTADAIKNEKALAVTVENILKSSGKDKELELYKVYLFK